MGLIEGLPVSMLIGVVYVLGLPGVIFVIWLVNLMRDTRLEKKRDEERLVSDRKRDIEQAALLDTLKAETRAILAAYREDVRAVTRFYEDNVLLVKNYQRLADDLSAIIHLNTQAQTQLVEKIKNNMFCPLVRERGPAL